MIEIDKTQKVRLVIVLEDEDAIEFEALVHGYAHNPESPLFWSKLAEELRNA